MRIRAEDAMLTLNLANICAVRRSAMITRMILVKVPPDKSAEAERLGEKTVVRY